MAKRNLQQMMEDMDYPPKVLEALVNDIAKNGNEHRIVSGEMTLPSRQDAIHWHDGLEGRAGLTTKEREMDDRIKALEAQLKDEAQPPENKPWPSEHSSTPPPPPPPAPPTPTS